MIHYRLKTQDIRSKNIVCLIEKHEDIKQLGFLHLEEHISQDIEKSVNETKSTMKEYFLGQQKHERLFVFNSLDTEYKKKVLFLGKYFPTLPDELCLFSANTESMKVFFEVCQLSRYRFQHYISKKIEKTTELFVDKTQKKELQDFQLSLENISLARDLGETPPCDLTPEIFANIVKKTKFKHITVKILSYKDIQKKGLGFIEAVGKGSANKPCVVILEHIRNKKGSIRGIVGKGVTFDTGGIQVKPGDHMYDMKGDMGGAAVTYALMKELDRHNVDKNIVACLVLAENVISDIAYKPSDIVRGYTGKTVEIIHTDAEGRLILADGMSYLGKNYKTSHMMTIATLTGACVMALGYRYAGLMGTDTEMIEHLLAYSRTHTEQYIQLPLDDHFIEKTTSQIADFKNLDRSVFAGSSMGAAFLSRFLENKEAYTHIDIAGTFINSGDPYGKMPKGMTGFGVESLSFILKN